MIKPIIIYSMARSRSTAVLQAARRERLFNEPFDFWAVSVSKDYSDLAARGDSFDIDLVNWLSNDLYYKTYS